MRRVRRLVTDYGLETALVVAVSTLVLQLSWPSINSWRNRPRPGCMVVQTRENASQTPLAGLANQYRVYLPREFGRATNRWPLILYLHGAGERGWNPTEVNRYGLPLHLGDDFHLPAIVVAPQCPPNQSWTPASLASLLNEIESKYPIDRKRVTVAGHSMGGFGAWALARHVPDRIAAALILCGGGKLEGGDQLADVAIWAIHGGADTVVPPARSLELISALKANGITAKHTLLPGEGHAIQDYPLSHPEVFDWLLSQRKPRARAA
jgi:predicted peptidase